MGFWIFMLVMDLLIPLSMIVLGRRFVRKPVEKINSVSGYRTARAMASEESWAFAQRYVGRLWQKTGIFLLPLSAVLLLLIKDRAIHTVSLWGALIATGQVVILCLTIIPVERALQRKFDH